MGNKKSKIPVDAELFTIRGEFTAYVESVYDGDTFKLIFKFRGEYDKYRLRLAGVDCPEMRPIKKKYDFDEKRIRKEKLAAVDAKNFVSDLILHETVTLIADGFDKYGRLLGSIIVDGQDLAESIIENGHGIVYDGGTKKLMN